MKINAHFNTIPVFLACLMVSILILAACTTTSGAPAKPPAATGPKYGGTLHLVYNTDIVQLDPVKSTAIVDRALPFLYTNSLVVEQGKNDEDLHIVPSLAKSWEIAPDGKTYTFHLVEGVKWQNLPPVNGRELTSADVKFSLDRISDPKTKAVLASYFAAVDRIETPDKYTVKIIMKTPDPSFMLSLCGGGMVAREVIERDGDANKTIIGTGPFILDKYSPGTGITFKKNPDYWEKGKPYVDRVECTLMSDGAVRLAGFRAGQIDRLSDDVTNMNAIKDTVSGARITPGISLLGSCLTFSLKQSDKPWADKKVRQALQYAIDYDGLIKSVVNGAGSRTDYLASSLADWGARQKQALPQRDVNKARAMLEEAGYPNGFKATIVQQTMSNGAWGPAVEPLTAMLKEIGVDATIVPTATADYVAKMRSGDYELGTTVLICTQPDPDPNLYNMYKTKAGYNRSSFSNARVDELLELQRKSIADVPQRQKYVKEIMQILSDQVPVVPLFYQYNFHITQPWVKGWENSCSISSSGYSWQEVSHVWLDK